LDGLDTHSASQNSGRFGYPFGKTRRNRKLALFKDYVPGVLHGDRIVDLSGIVGPAVMHVSPVERMPAIIADFDRLRPKIAGRAGRSVNGSKEVTVALRLSACIGMFNTARCSKVAV
jgi:hypothetical protein